MITCEQDPDVVRWGLNLLEGGEPFLNSEYSAPGSQHEINAYNGVHSTECPYNSELTDLENDEILAHALQEELSHLAIAESMGTSNAGDEQMQASILAQDWFCPRDYCSGQEIGPEDNEMRPSSSCSSPGGNSSDGNNWFGSLELPEEFSMLDGEVGKRLNQMVPVPHIPRTNGDIPSDDEVISDHQRLLNRLELYDLVELKVQGDGNCQFRALSDQFYRTPEHHKFVRQQVVNQLKTQPEIYEGYVPMAYEDYLKKMSKEGEWGDHVTLQAAADSYGVKIFVITSFKDTCYIEILPNIQKSNRIIFLSFWAEVHYNSIYPEGDLQGR